MNTPPFVPSAPPPSQPPHEIHSTSSLVPQRPSQEMFDECFAYKPTVEELQETARSSPSQGVQYRTSDDSYQLDRDASPFGGNLQGRPEDQGGKTTLVESNHVEYAECACIRIIPSFRLLKSSPHSLSHLGYHCHLIHHSQLGMRL